ncbi:MAG: hypothetical protein HGA45_35710 [Chloroflexales bacterium]|nr:hypothetical protein [Chloroflexales bacterium]
MITHLSSQQAQRNILRWAVIVALVLWPLLLPAALPALHRRGGAPPQRVTTYDAITAHGAALGAVFP